MIFASRSDMLRISIFMSSTSDTPAAAAALLARAVVRDRGHVFDASHEDAVAGQATDGGLGAGSRGAGLVAAVSADADVDGGEALLLERLGDLLGRGHGGERAALVLVGLDDHAARALRDGLGTREVGHGDVDVVVAREDVRDAPLLAHWLASLEAAGAEGAADGAAGADSIGAS